ncbi:DUF6638 family protein [Paracoccus pacificus]|uniref:DUF6638 family protein n=1 Tax=Paracoccus pacificus TaxID=1463598 RepID=A0ABW4R908_9RHOB
MKRLIEKGLMFGNLVLVDSPAWVARYNRALEKLTGKTTDLTEFHIDLAGHSPEVGDALGDLDYLSPKGANRQFILLTTEQKTAPLLNPSISALRDILRRFIVENESQLLSLTARDAVLGEIEDHVWELATPADLAAVTQIKIIADTTGRHIAEADRMAALIERFRTEPGGWYDDVLIAQMITQAKSTGDVTRNPVHLGRVEFPIPDFHAEAFGGVYMIRSVPEPAMIFSDKTQLTNVPGLLSIAIEDRNLVAGWLARNGLAEPIATAHGTDAAAILRQKIDFVLVDAANRMGLDQGDGSRSDLRRAAARMGERLPPEIAGLAALLRWVETGGDWPVIDSSNPAYFHAIRATAGPARDVINMLLAEMAPQDVRNLYILNKPLFYRLYATWPEPKKEYVANLLSREYQMDKQGTRAALFGGEPDMRPPDPSPSTSGGNAVTGPWGSASSMRLNEAGLEGPAPAGPWGRAG